MTTAYKLLYGGLTPQRSHFSGALVPVNCQSLSFMEPVTRYVGSEAF